MSGFLAIGGAQRGDDVAAISGQSLGAVLANAYAGFSSPAGTVFLSAGVKFQKPNPDDDHLVLKSTAVKRDQEITAYIGRGTLFLRINGSAPGRQRAFYFTHNQAALGGGGDIRVGLATNFDETATMDPAVGTGSADGFYINTNVTASAEGIAAGYSPTYAPGDKFTFGVRGFEIYLQFNGHDICRYIDWRHMEDGRCGVWAHQGYGCSDVTVHYPPYRSLYSTPSNGTYDPRDFGMRAIGAVTGTISAASNVLVLPANVGFKVGDPIIVAVGGEAGGGVRGEIGVGGSWPPLNYANTTAMNADTGKPGGTWAQDSSSGFVYNYDGASWVRRNDGAGNVNQGYYTFLRVPIALVTTVNAVSADGKTLTLAANAGANATNASVYLDCYPGFYMLTSALLPGNNPISPKVSIPAGAWAISAVIGNVSPWSDGLEIFGQGSGSTTIMCPKGIVSSVWNLEAINSVTIRDMTLQGNHGPNGYGYNAATSGGGATGGSLCTIGLSSNGVMRNLIGIDPFSNFMEHQNCTDTWSYNCSMTANFTHNAYSGWMIQSSNGIRGGFQDCTITAVALIKGFETFNGDSCQFIRCGGQNACASTNSSGGWLFDSYSVTITAGSKPATNPQGVDEQIMTISAHAFPTDGLLAKGGTITNPRIVQQGYIDASNNVQKAIQVESTNPFITITGQYPESGSHTTTKGGYFSAPSYDPGSPEYGNLAIMIDAVGCTVSGLRVDGGTAIGSPGHSSHFGNISTTQAGTVISSCVADAIHGGAQSGNQSNTGY